MNNEYKIKKMVYFSVFDFSTNYKWKRNADGSGNDFKVDKFAKCNNDLNGMKSAKDNEPHGNLVRTFSLGPLAYNGRDLLTSDLSGALSTGSMGEQCFDIGLIVQMTNGHLTQRLLIPGDTNASNKSLYSVHSVINLLKKTSCLTYRYVTISNHLQVGNVGKITAYDASEKMANSNIKQKEQD
ncbi:hypothetical protein T01_13343 [Trichinella spiralis]|uniref:Uncharacterized protein n=1 Tax=Trichinella spiralis TaxID=6334 RepID=A0A0V1BQ79_TRISP|nr:hypothetical protein T01_13343 [Trichinella spiralis]